jgi:hypothetical protein
MTLGTNDKKKVAILGVLGLGCAYLVYSNLLSGPSGAPSATAPASRAAGNPDASGELPPAPVPGTKRAGPGGLRGRTEEFHPVLRSKRPEERIDPMSVDPTLKLEVLAKLEAQGPAGAGRNLFQFGVQPVKAELPKGPEPKVVPKPGAAQQASKEPPKPAAPPPPPPINLKYYGYSTQRENGKKTAFFLDGEEILVASEGDTLKRRYRVVRIGTTSVVMEDLESKREQPLPLAEELGG